MDERKTYTVEMWPGRVVKVKAINEEEAFVQAVVDNGWIGSSESTGNGQRFMAWVTESKED